MNPLCWLANTLKLTVAVKCERVRLLAVICVHVQGLFVSVWVFLGMTVVLVCALVRILLWLCVAHRWVGYAVWAQRGWLSYKPYQPIAPLLTIRP